MSARAGRSRRCSVRAQARGARSPANALSRLPLCAPTADRRSPSVAPGLRLGALSADGKLRVYDALDVMQLGSWSLVDEVDVPGALCFAWGQHTAGSVCLVVGYSDGSAVILADGGGRKWTEVCRLSDARDAIQSVSWAPHIGRTMQLIAMGGRDGAVYVYTLRPPAAGAGPAAGGWEAKLAARLPEHGDAVWRVEWNATGSLLASSGDDGTVRVWQPDATGTRAPAAWSGLIPALLPPARTHPRGGRARPLLLAMSDARRPVAVRLDREERRGCDGRLRAARFGVGAGRSPHILEPVHVIVGLGAGKRASR